MAKKGEIISSKTNTDDQKTDDQRADEFVRVAYNEFGSGWLTFVRTALRMGFDGTKLNPDAVRKAAESFEKRIE